MKTVLWATLTANGNYAQPGPAYPPAQEMLDSFAMHVRQHGNLVVGRRTFDGFTASDGDRSAFTNIDVVVVSSRDVGNSAVIRAATPKEALGYLEQRNHQTALLVGGERLLNSFLAQNLVDELVVNITPTLESKGRNLVLDNDQYKMIELLNCTPIGSGVVQLHYALHR